ncbi:MAG: acetylxylan esterase [Oscillospiraceae bacterium]|nr:acetylxylan esterase [Oscillospiraceae bacterium]
MKYEERFEESLKKKIFPQTNNQDFEAFWRKEIEQLRQKPVEITRKKLELPYDKTFTTYEIKFNTHDETVVDAFFSVPNDGKEKHPCVIVYHGGGERKEIFADILATGACCFAMDVRSQGGTTVDKANYTSGDMLGGIMTRGILDKREFYMKNIYLDAIRAVDVVETLPEVDPERIVTYGASQGGALSITASALSRKVKKCYTAVTSYCCIPQRVYSATGVFASTHSFLRTYPEYTDTAMDTLSYFDMNNMVSLLSVPSLFCVALADKICLPEYVYSAYAHAECEKELLLVPFAPHCIPECFKMQAYSEFADLAGE